MRKPKASLSEQTTTPTQAESSVEDASTARHDRPYIYHNFTNSLCHKCLKVVSAKVILQDNKVYLLKTCPEHGALRTLLSSDASYYLSQTQYNKPGTLPRRFQTPVEKGCPLDCGLCTDHEQHTCLALIEITEACNLRCPTCFADSDIGRYSPLDEVERMLDTIVENEGYADVVQISGGEPTIHPHILEILELAKAKRIKALMINTNGVRIARDEDFVRSLSKFKGNLGMMEADIPLGPAVSFLLASPTINLGAIILLFVVFGWRIAVFYMCACLLAAVLVGWAIGRIPREMALRDYLWFLEDEPAAGEYRVALRKAVVLGRQLTRKFLPWLALATLGGILIDTLVPTSTVASLSTLSIGAGIPVAALLGSVIYADILLLIPVGYALVQHGASIPVVLTFMLAASGLSLPEMVVLGRVLRLPLVLLFVGATVAIYVLVGFVFLWV